ncbi:alkaline phosphatase [Roseibacillus ishigakijimensis]|uniref:Alkaline phosphatase n=1 Tax=Roseibacillus ishigakijimensis TaxID=454146 RepID=A0A934VKP1_9BACT|nr:alkaline phosphatase [Roseibacillus ishigakijimensis]MBK1833854.1 alkaline phosphatase [Roseibacillus ishigakijimensis]
MKSSNFSLNRRHLLQASLSAGVGSFLFSGSARAEEKMKKGQRPTGIVFMVSDGMSQGVLPMAEAFSQQIRQKGTAWWQLLSHPTAAHGLMDTPSFNSLVTDSAAASSAWSSGQRVPNGQICVDAKGANLEPIGLTLSKEKARLGLVTTSRVTHATPAGFATNSPSRDDEDFIAPQFLDRAEILLGGGTRHFKAGDRKDGRDLFADYEKAGYQVVGSRDELFRAGRGKLLGTFWDSHLPYSLDRNQSAALQKQVPTLAEMTSVALRRFLSGRAPFLLQVEGARVDHAAHGNDIGGLLHDQLAFDDAVAKVLEMVSDRDDILVVVTSDHGNANPALNGTGARYTQTNQHFEHVAKLKASHEELLARWKKKEGGVKDWQKLVENTCGFQPTQAESEAVLDSISGREVIEWSHQLNNPAGLLGQMVGNHTGTGWTGVSHTADPTQLSALGAGSEQFSGLIRNDSVRDRILGLLLG